MFVYFGPVNVPKFTAEKLPPPNNFTFTHLTDICTLDKWLLLISSQNNLLQISC